MNFIQNYKRKNVKFWSFVILYIPHVYYEQNQKRVVAERMLELVLQTLFLPTKILPLTARLISCYNKVKHRTGTNRCAEFKYIWRYFSKDFPIITQKVSGHYFQNLLSPQMYENDISTCVKE